MMALTEAAIAAARLRMERAVKALKQATETSAADPTLWMHVAMALECATYAVAHVDDAMKLEGLATADTLPPLPMPPESEVKRRAR